MCQQFSILITVILCSTQLLAPAKSVYQVVNNHCHQLIHLLADAASYHSSNKTFISLVQLGTSLVHTSIMGTLLATVTLA